MAFLGNILILAINIYIGILVISIVLYWLMAFDVVNPKSLQARNLISVLEKVTQPPLRFLGRFIPPIGGIDLTPVVLIIGLELLKSGIAHLFFF